MKKKTTPWPKIRKTPNGTYLVDARIKGKGDRHFFKTKAEADTKAAQLRVARQNSGTQSLAFPEKLRIEATEAAAALEAVGATIAEAVAFYLKHAKPQGGIVTVQALAEKFLADKKHAGRRPEYLRPLKSMLKNFCDVFGTQHAHEVEHVAIEDWMRGQPWELRTFKNYRNSISTLFQFAMRHGRVASNPMDRIEKVTLDEAEIEALTVEEAKRLLQAAKDNPAMELLAFVAIGLFCGLRTAELKALRWEQISLADDTVTVSSQSAKGRGRRTVPIQPNLRAILEPLAREAGPISKPKNLHNRWEDLRALAGFRDENGVWSWKDNGMRHSFGSYRLAVVEDVAKVSLEMGNSPEMIFKHYRKLVTPTAAAEFWKLNPTA